MGIEKENYGVTKEGQQVTKYTLTNGQGDSVSFLDYGAAVSYPHLDVYKRQRAGCVDNRAWRRRPYYDHT